MSQQAGWYDDPQDDANLRYWDGVQWTNHTAPKQKPNLDRAGQWQAPGEQGSTQGHGQQQGGYGQQGYGQQQGGYGQPNPYAGQTGQSPYQGEWQGQMTPGGYQQQNVPSTPDGQPLAGWWHRVGARILDGLLIGIVGGALATFLVPGFFQGYMDWAATMDDPFAPPPAELVALQLRWTLTLGIIGILYEVVMVSLAGGTVGKLITGLRVRLRDEPGKIGWGPSVMRALVYQGVGLIAQLNAALSVLGLFHLINVLWPLWDSKKQAIHDKVAKTNVVKNR
ncbi:RDD family protein [Serinicoccus sp. LYQ131]|uniref:RDD family protein n=1 Tax=Serinicoccus sp. LYQ131 TaxID=3378797 RepID=UPI003854378D